MSDPELVAPHDVDRIRAEFSDPDELGADALVRSLCDEIERLRSALADFVEATTSLPTDHPKVTLKAAVAQARALIDLGAAR